MLNSPWYSATTAHEIFQAFQPMYVDSLENTYASIEARYAERPMTGVWRSVDDDNVAWMTFKVPGTTVVFFKGLERAAHVQRFMAGVRPGDQGSNAAPFNEAGMGMAARFLQEMAGRNFFSGQRTFITGHSMGGTVAACCRHQLRNGDSSSLHLITIGEARTTSPAGVAAAASWDSRRWMTLNDPVCHLPAYSSVVPEAWLLFDLNLQRAVEQLQHRQGGMQISITGVVTPVNNIPVPGQGFRSAMVQWGRGFQTGVPQAHNLVYYIAALANARLAEGAAPRPAPAAPPEPFRPRMTLAEAQAAVEVAFPPAERVDVPMHETARGTTPQQKFFTYEKEKGVYNVYWSGAIIASFAKRRGASRCVQAGNRFVRAYIRAYAGNDEQFEAAASAFATALPD